MANIFSKLSEAQKNKLGLAGGILGMLGLGLLFLLTSEKPVTEKFKPVYEYGGDFVVQSNNGTVALKDFRDKVVVLYFGFLSCTEACPVSMATMVGAINKLSDAERKQLQVIFISVDPERDDIKALQAFAGHYQKYFKNSSNPNVIMAATDTKEKIKKLSEMYGVFFDIVDLEGSAFGYTVDHSSRFYLINPQGQLETTMSHSTTPVELAARIKELQND